MCKMFGKSKKRREFLWPKTLDIKNMSTTKSKYDLEVVAKIIVSYIFNYQTIKLAIINNEKLLDECSSEDCKLQALLAKSNDVYQLVIRKNPIEDPLSIICHEMIHLNQIERKDLILTTDMKTVTWKNNVYDYTYPYRKRPWEIEAINNTPKIQRRVLSLYYE